jgi:hypothetical protein
MKKELSNNKTAIYRRNYRIKNRDKILAEKKKYRLNHKKEISISQKPYQKRYRDGRSEYEKQLIKEYQKQYGSINKEKRREIRHFTNVKYNLLRKYNLTLMQYNNLFITQNGCCAICGIHQSELSSTLAVDHNHDTNEVRGLLCRNCNIGLGCFKDSIDFLNNSINYLKK